MKQRAARLWVLAGLATLTAAAGARMGEGPTTLAIMHKAFTNKRSPLAVVKKELSSETPDREKVRQATEKFVTLAEALARNEPRHGERASWKRLTDEHVSDVRAMHEAAGRGDMETVRAAYTRVANSCKACHDAHKFRPDR